MLNLRYYPDGDPNGVVLPKVYVIKGEDIDGNPIERSVIDAHFKIAVDGVEIVDLSLGDGLTWNDTTKTLTLLLRNSHLSEIVESTDGDYQLYFQIETGRIVTPFSGRTYMERSL